MENPLILQNITKDIHIRDVLLDMENALKLDPTSREYLELKTKLSMLENLIFNHCK
jgi:hypothetical protein